AGLDGVAAVRLPQLAEIGPDPLPSDALGGLFVVELAAFLEPEEEPAIAKRGLPPRRHRPSRCDAAALERIARSLCRIPRLAIVPRPEGDRQALRPGGARHRSAPPAAAGLAPSA